MSVLFALSEFEKNIEGWDESDYEYVGDEINEFLSVYLN